MLFLITKYLQKFHIKIPEGFLKEEIVRWYADNYSERIIENPLALRALPKRKSRILDVGCRYSMLPIQLANLGHEVYGIDLFPYKRKHPNFKFVQGDFLKNKFKKNFFDVVVSISTIEHIGLNFYGEGRNLTGDMDVVNKIYELIKPGGIFLMTVPFGITKDTSWYRIYNIKRLRQLLKSFKKIYITTYQKSKTGAWFEELPTVAEKKLEFSGEVRGVAFVKALK